MTEENKVEDTNQVPETKPEVDPIVERATSMGWRPIEDWEGPEEDFIDAKEFVRRQPLFEKIEHQSKELKELRKAFDAFKTHHSKVKEAEYNRALQQLKASRKEAMVNGETEKALYIEEKIEEISEQKAEFDNSVAQIPTPTQVQPEFVRWQEQNSWYQKDRAMTAFADILGVELAKQGMSPEAVLAEVTKEVKKEFAHKFQNPRRAVGSPVEAAPRRGVTKEPEFVMTDEEKQIMKRIVRAGGIDEATYIAELKKVR